MDGSDVFIVHTGTKLLFHHVQNVEPLVLLINGQAMEEFVRKLQLQLA